MTKNPYFKEYFHYTALSILGTLGVSCYILADTFFISKGLGTAGLAALNLAIPMYNLIHGCGLMLGMGGGTIFSIACGRKDKCTADASYTNMLSAAAVLSVIFMLTGIFLPRQLAALLGADRTVMEMTAVYLRWLLIFAPAFIINDILLCYVRNDGAPKLAMAATLTGSLANILLDYIFIFPMNMGIFGAILATGLSPVISIMLMLPRRISGRNTFCPAPPLIRGSIMKKCLSAGFPSLISQLASGIVMVVFNGIILKLEGNTGVAAYGVIANISLVVSAIYTGIAQGVQPLISNYYGKNKLNTAVTMLRYSIVSMLIVSAVIYGALYMLADPITAVFNSENDPLMQKSAAEGMKLYFLSNPFTGFSIIIAVFFTSAEHAVPAHILSLLRCPVLIIPAAFAMSAALGMTGVWLAFPLSELTAAVIGSAVYFRVIKKLRETVG